MSKWVILVHWFDASVLSWTKAIKWVVVEESWATVYQAHSDIVFSKLLVDYHTVIVVAVCR